MKCEIIRDLLPLYVDGLTSQESNEEIEAHTGDCTTCREILAQMKKETEAKPEGLEKKTIDPFRKFNRRMKANVVAAVAICIGFGGVGWKGFVKGFAIDPEEVTLDVHTEEDMLYLDFALDSGNIMHSGTMYDGINAEIGLRRVWRLPFDDRDKEPNRFSWGMDMDILEIGSGESMNVVMKSDGMNITTAENPKSVSIQNGDAAPVTLMTFIEDDVAVSITSGEVEGDFVEEYTVTINYGNEMATYTLAELLEMAEK